MSLFDYDVFVADELHLKPATSLRGSNIRQALALVDKSQGPFSYLSADGIGFTVATGNDLTIVERFRRPQNAGVLAL